MKIYSNKREGGTHKRTMFWAELKKVLGWRNVLGWTENGFGLKREFFWAEKNVFGLKKKGNTWTEKKRKAGRKETKERRLKEGKGGAKLLQKGALKTEPEKKRKRKKGWTKKRRRKGRCWTE